MMFVSKLSGIQNNNKKIGSSSIAQLICAADLFYPEK